MSTKEEAIYHVLEGLQALICLGASATARREYVPTHNADDDDDMIKAGNYQVTALRSMREQFENLMFTGTTESR